MVVPMAGDFVSVGTNLADDVEIPRNRAAEHEERPTVAAFSRSALISGVCRGSGQSSKVSAKRLSLGSTTGRPIAPNNERFWR